MSNLKSHFINEVIGPLLVALIHIFELKNPILQEQAMSFLIYSGALPEALLPAATGCTSSCYK